MAKTYTQSDIRNVRAKASDRLAGVKGKLKNAKATAAVLRAELREAKASAKQLAKRVEKLEKPSAAKKSAASPAKGAPTSTHRFID